MEWSQNSIYLPLPNVQDFTCEIATIFCVNSFLFNVGANNYVYDVNDRYILSSFPVLLTFLMSGINILSRHQNVKKTWERCWVHPRESTTVLRCVKLFLKFRVSV